MGVALYEKQKADGCPSAFELFRRFMSAAAD
jgi:hypothetical protein